MNTLHEKPVSLRKFAKMTGTSDGGVRKFIKANPDNASVVDGKILPSVASIEWGKAISGNYELLDNGEWEILTADGIKPDMADILKPLNSGELENEPADDLSAYEDSAYLREELINEPLDLAMSGDDISNQVYTGDEDVINTKEDKADFLRGIPDGTSKIEADRLFAVYRARKVKRELQRLEGELVDKAQVYKNLYEFSVTIRENFTNIPDRVIDNIRAADSRHDAMKILADEIGAVLLLLSGAETIKLTTE